KIKVQDYVTEITDRLPYFESLYLLDQAQLIIVPGSTDTAYTASKIYPYVLLNKKLLAVFNYNSSVVSLLQKIGYGQLVVFNHLEKSTGDYVDECYEKLENLVSVDAVTGYNKQQFEPYLAFSKTKDQVDFFNYVTNR